MLDNIVSEIPIKKEIYQFSYTLGLQPNGSKINARVIYYSFIEDPSSIMTVGEFFTTDGFGNSAVVGNFIPSELAHFSDRLIQEDMIAQENM